MDWSWLPEYGPKFVGGVWITIQLLVISFTFGILLAVPIGLVQVTGPRVLSWLALGFCTFIRGTPLLIQLWLLYHGFGKLFPYIEGIRDTWYWPFLIEGYYYAIVGFTLSVAGYAGEVMRAGFAGVPKGELEAARAQGMRPFTILRRIWLPRAVQNVLPTLANECVFTLKSTPLAATITVFDVFGVGTMVRQETYKIYEPLLFVAGIYILMTGVIVLLFRWLENRVPKPPVSSGA